MILELIILILLVVIFVIGYLYVDKSNALALARAELTMQHQKELFIQTTHEAQKAEFKNEMSLMMQQLLEGKIKTFDETSTKALENLLKPFKENIDTFRQKVELGQKESGERFAVLSREIEQVMKAGLSITNEAQNLAKALKGEKQTQGRWGEMVLESVLESSGLIKNEHYLLQQSYRDEEGNAKRPDVVVKLPAHKSIIIDSKVSLVGYDKYISATTDESKQLALKEMALSFRSHVDILSSKDYTAYDIGTLEYVFMFVPIEASFSTVIHYDPTLYEYALGKHIVIVYPSTLIITLKTIYMFWQRDKADSAVEQLYVESGKLYDKLYGFVETFDKVGKQLDTLNGSYQNATTQLYNGSGNLLKRAENIKTLGAKTTKNLKNLKITNSELDDEEIEITTLENKGLLI